jgi:hypothetical protein
LENYALIALPWYEAEPSPEARAKAFIARLRECIDDLMAEDEKRGIVADELFFSLDRPLSINERYASAIARLGDPKVKDRRHAEYLEDKALDDLSDMLVAPPANNSAHSDGMLQLSTGDSYEYIEHEGHLTITPERPNEQTCVKRVAIRPLVGDLQVLRLLYSWTGKGDRPGITLNNLPSEYYLGTFPEPIPTSTFWSHLIYVGALKLDTRGLISVEFVEHYIDSGGTFKPEFAHTPVRDNMTFLRLAVQLPPGVETATYSEIVNPDWRPTPLHPPAELLQTDGWFAIEQSDKLKANIRHVIEWDDSSYKQ